MSKRKDGFRIIEDTTSGDFVFEAYGDTLPQLLANCATACFSAMTDLDKIKPERSFTVEASGSNIDELLYNFISQLIYLKDVEKVFFCEFDIHLSGDKTRLKAVARGQPIDYDKHTMLTDVKAITYHQLHVRKENGQFMVRVTLDL